MKRLLFAIVLLLAVLSAAQSLPANATGDSIWINQQKLKTEIGESVPVTSPPIATQISGQSCFKTVFKIRRYTSIGVQDGQTLWEETKDDETEVCAISSGIGLIAYHSGGTYIQFPGSTHAVRIHSTVKNFNVTVIPVPSSRTVIVQTGTSTSYAAASTHIFYNFLGVGEMTRSQGEDVYYLRHWPQRFADYKGDSLEMSNFTFSNNGEWMLVIARNAVMRIRIKDKEMQTIARGTTDGGTQYKMSITSDGRYAFVQSYHLGFGNPVIYDLQGCQPSQEHRYGFTPQLVPGCKDRQIRNDLLNAVPGFLLLEQVRFSYDGQTLSGFVSYRERVGAPVFKNHITIMLENYVKPSLEYLALGDSFSSGEGDTEGGTWYEPGTDTSNNKCHLSRRSYPYLVAEQVGLHNGPNQSPVTDSLFRSVACSGALSLDILRTDNDYEGQIKDGRTREERDIASILKTFSPGQIGQVEFLGNHKPKIVTISIIGNDIDFSGKLRRCIGIGPSTCFDSYEDRLEILQEIQGKFNDLVQLYEDLKTASPGVRIYALGYPTIINPDGNCAVNVRLNKTEAQMANDLVEFLNATIESAAKKAGVTYIDVAGAFFGKRLCENRPQFLAVNGLTAGNDILLWTIGNESYHPNPIGHQRLAERVLQQTDALTQTMPNPDPTTTPPDPFNEKYADFFQGYEHRARPLHSLISDDGLADDMLIPLQQEQASLYAPGPGDYELWANSDPVYLGTFTPDEEGIIHLNYTIPTGIEPGFHTLYLYGKNAGGVDVAIYKTVFIAANETDYDGDGIPNDKDSCPMLPPTGIDEDNDGIDDGCDNFISDPPAEPVANEDPKPPANNPETVAGNEPLPTPDEPATNTTQVSDPNHQPTPARTLRQTSEPTEEDDNSVLASTSITPNQDNSDSPRNQTFASVPTNISSPSSKKPFTWIVLATLGALAAILALIRRHLRT